MEQLSGQRGARASPRLARRRRAARDVCQTAQPGATALRAICGRRYQVGFTLGQPQGAGVSWRRTVRNTNASAHPSRQRRCANPPRTAPPQAAAVSGNRKPLARQGCRHHCGLCDGRLFLPADRRLLRDAFYVGGKNCSGRGIMWERDHAFLLDLTLMLKVTLMLKEMARTLPKE